MISLTRNLGAAALLLLAAARGDARAENWPVLVARPDQNGGVSIPGFLVPPWFWFGAGQPVLVNPLWSGAGTIAMLAPPPWRPTPVFDTRVGGVSILTSQDQRSGGSADAYAATGSSSGLILNFNGFSVLNMGVNNAW